MNNATSMRETQLNIRLSEDEASASSSSARTRLNGPNLLRFLLRKEEKEVRSVTGAPPRRLRPRREEVLEEALVAPLLGRWSPGRACASREAPRGNRRPALPFARERRPVRNPIEPESRHGSEHTVSEERRRRRALATAPPTPLRLRAVPRPLVAPRPLVPLPSMARKLDPWGRDDAPVLLSSCGNPSPRR